MIDEQKIIGMLQARALGCLDENENKELQEFIDAGHLFPWDELGKFQNVASLLPFALELELPDPELKDRVALKLIKLSEQLRANKILEEGKFEIEEDMLLRFGYSETITRPTLEAMRPVTNIGTTRPDILLASGGNPYLTPFLSTNWDVSYEWYYADASAVSIGIFSKDVEGFISISAGSTLVSTFNDGLTDAEKTAMGLNLAVDYGIAGTIESNPELFDPATGYRYIEMKWFDRQKLDQERSGRPRRPHFFQGIFYLSRQV